MRKLLFACLFFSLSLTCFNTSAQVNSWLWARMGNTTGSAEGMDVVTDKSNNIYVVGDFTETLKLSTGNLVSSGLSDIFFAKYDPSGNLLWAKRAGGVSMELEFGASIVLGSDNSIYIVGAFLATASFGGIPITSNGMMDVFIAKYDLNGNIIWAINAGGIEDDRAYSVCLDMNDDDNIYITGYIQNTATFGTTSLTSNGDWDIFIAKYDSAGNNIWAKNFGNNLIDIGRAITVDTDNNIYVTGSFDRLVDFGGTSLESDFNHSDVFIGKYDINGDLVWIKKGGGFLEDYGYGIAVDRSNVYITGACSQTPIFENDTLDDEGLLDIFIVKYGKNGTYKWGKAAGSVVNDYGFAIAIGKNNDLLITGAYNYPVTFGTITTPSIGAAGFDIFVANYDKLGNCQWVTSAGGLSQDVGWGIIADNNGNAIVTGYIEDSTMFDTINLKNIGHFDMFVGQIGEPVTPTIFITSHPSPTSLNVCGGDTVTYTVSATGSNISYQWRKAGFDILGANSQTLIIYTTALSNGAYTCTLFDSNYSVTSNSASLSVDDGPVILSQPTSTTKELGQSVTFSVTVTAPTALTYQWMKDGVDLGSATLNNYKVQNINAGDSGYYSCYISDDCGSLLSEEAKLTVTGLPGISENSIMNQFRISPNPNNGKFFLENPRSKEIEISLFNPLGELLLNIISSDRVLEINLKGTKTGIYFIQIVDKENLFIKTEKIIIE